jgi:hypothetical protein
VHPIVAAALRERAPEVLGGGRSGRVAGGATAQDEGAVGWPAPPPDGSGLGWPDDADPADPESRRAASEDRVVTMRDRRAALPEQPARRRPGWRRWLGRPAGPPERAPQGTTVA